jgi:hypothetical protein
MKTVISIAAFAGLMSLAACNTSAIREKEAALNAQQRRIDSMTLAMTRAHVVDSMNEALAQMQYNVQTMPTVQKTERVVVYQQSAPRRARRSSSSSYSGYTQPASYQEPAYQQPVAYQQPRKKGWSAKAKGAVIGAGTGAIAGAVINGRNRGVGAVIGGVLGAGAGTGIGAIIDRRNGR